MDRLDMGILKKNPIQNFDDPIIITKTEYEKLVIMDQISPNILYFITDEIEDIQPRILPITFGNCCNCGAPLSGNAHCGYCGTYNAKYTS